MNKNKHGSIELPPANLNSYIWADRKRETTNRKPRIAVCGKMAKLDLKVSVLRLCLTANVNLFHVRNQVSPFLLVYVHYFNTYFSSFIQFFYP